MASLEEILRARFTEVTAHIANIEATSKPLRDARDALRQQMEPIEEQMRALDLQIRDAESPLFDLKNEVGTIVRALKGKTSAPGEEPEVNDAASPETESDEGAK